MLHWARASAVLCQAVEPVCLPAAWLYPSGWDGWGGCCSRRGFVVQHEEPGLGLGLGLTLGQQVQRKLTANECF